MSVFKQLLKTLNQERIEKWLVDDYFKNILKSRLKDLARRVWDLWQMLGNKNKTSPLSNCHLTANWLKRNTMMWIECANKEHFPFSFSSLFTFSFSEYIESEIELPIIFCSVCCSKRNWGGQRTLECWTTGARSEGTTKNQFHSNHLLFHDVVCIKLLANYKSGLTDHKIAPVKGLALTKV